MMRHEDVLAELRGFFAQEFLDGKEEGLDGETPLLELGVIDSFSIVLFLNFVKERFGIDVPNTEINVQNLKNLEALTALLLRLSAKDS